MVQYICSLLSVNVCLCMCTCVSRLLAWNGALLSSIRVEWKIKVKSREIGDRIAIFPFTFPFSFSPSAQSAFTVSPPPASHNHQFRRTASTLWRPYLIHYHTSRLRYVICNNYILHVTYITHWMNVHSHRNMHFFANLLQLIYKASRTQIASLDTLNYKSAKQIKCQASWECYLYIYTFIHIYTTHKAKSASQKLCAGKQVSKLLSYPNRHSETQERLMGTAWAMEVSAVTLLSI